MNRYLGIFKFSDIPWTNNYTYRSIRNYDPTCTLVSRPGYDNINTHPHTIKIQGDIHSTHQYRCSWD